MAVTRSSTTPLSTEQLGRDSTPDGSRAGGKVTVRVDRQRGDTRAASETSTAAGGRGASAIATPRMWLAFVVGWLPGLGFSAWAVAQHRPDLPRLAIVLPAFAALGGLYLWLTLRDAMGPADVSSDGPSPSTLRRRYLLLALMTAVIVALITLLPRSGVWWLVMYPIVAAGLVLPPLHAGALTAGLVGLSIGSAVLATGAFDVMLLLQFAFGAGAIAIRRLTITVAQLRAAREEVARLAVTEERLRFARDLHDLLGHSLSMIVLKSELAGRLLPAAPGGAATEIRDVERAARQALSQVRAAVAGYRQPSLRGELAAARELLAAAGIAVEIEEVAAVLPPAQDGLLAWAVREGVTNVIRHSRARRCTITISEEAGWVRATIADDGRGLTQDEGGSGSGSGLSGLAERTAVLGGRLDAGSVEGNGFRLVVEAPVKSTAEARGDDPDSAGGRSVDGARGDGRLAQPRRGH